MFCDVHFHVFGPADRYPYGTDLRYPPPQAPLADYLEHMRPLGFDRFVFVQPSAYGRDNRCMLDAMRELPGCKAIVDVDENAPDAELERLKKAGVIGVRVNVSPVKPMTPGFGATLLPRIRRLEARCAELGWQLDFLLPGWLTSELMGTLRELKVDYTLAHFGMYLAKDGPSQAGFQELLRLVKESRCWIKLTGAYRISTAPGFADIAPMAQALIEAAPDRLVWGSDYPHLSFHDKVTTEALFSLLKSWAPDERTLTKILAENPTRLYAL